jgi:hypothetical protein
MAKAASLVIAILLRMSLDGSVYMRQSTAHETCPFLSTSTRDSVKIFEAERKFSFADSQSLKDYTHI